MPSLTSDLQQLLGETPVDLARTALAVSRVESPRVEIDASMTRLDDLGGRAAARLAALCDAPVRDRLAALSRLLYDEEGFRGNRDQYDDVRNSLLPVVLERRLGIPISLAVIYLEVARRAGLQVDGINFPGHFLLRARESGARDTASELVIIDPFHGGAQLSEYDCRQLLRQHVGDEAAFDGSLLAPATRQEIVVRMLVNLKRLYVRMRSFPQARVISSLLLGIDPAAVSELRDRGLLAYHLEDFPAALRDLEEYLRLAPKSSEPAEHDLVADQDEEEGESHPDDDASQIWEHVKTLRKRVASFN
jgi:regulator of sirC expression with transglutaminase-like and TPR domain